MLTTGDLIKVLDSARVGERVDLKLLRGIGDAQVGRHLWPDKDLPSILFDLLQTWECTLPGIPMLRALLHAWLLYILLLRSLLSTRPLIVCSKLASIWATL